MMGEAIEERRRHFGVAKNPGPFAEAQVCGDDDAGAFVDFAQQVKEQGAAGRAEREVTQLIEDNEVVAHKSLGQLSGLSVCFLLFESIDQFDGRVEPRLFPVMFDGLDGES